MKKKMLNVIKYAAVLAIIYTLFISIHFSLSNHSPQSKPITESPQKSIIVVGGQNSIAHTILGPVTITSCIGDGYVANYGDDFYRTKVFTILIVLAVISLGVFGVVFFLKKALHIPNTFLITVCLVAFISILIQIIVFDYILHFNIYKPLCMF